METTKGSGFSVWGLLGEKRCTATCSVVTSTHHEPAARPSHLEGQGDLVSRLITPITHIVTLVIVILDLFIKSP